MADKRITLLIYSADRELWRGGAITLGVTRVDSDGTATQVKIQRLQKQTSSVLITIDVFFDQQQAYLIVLTAPRHRDAWYAVTHESFLRADGATMIERDEIILRMLLVPKKTAPAGTTDAYEQMLAAGSPFVTKPGLSPAAYQDLGSAAKMTLLNIEAKLRSTRINGTPLLAYVQGVSQVDVDRVYLLLDAEAKSLIKDSADFASAPGHEGKVGLPSHPDSWKHKRFATGNLQVSFAKDPDTINGLQVYSVDADIDLERGIRHIVEWLDNNVFKVNKTDQTRVYALLYGQGIIPYYKLTPIIARTS